MGTPSGNILKELFKSGIKLGISSRGLGSVETIGESGAQEVQPDFELIYLTLSNFQLTDFITNERSADKTQQYEQRPIVYGVEQNN